MNIKDLIALKPTLLKKYYYLKLPSDNKLLTEEYAGILYFRNTKYEMYRLNAPAMVCPIGFCFFKHGKAHRFNAPAYMGPRNKKFFNNTIEQSICFYEFGKIIQDVYV